MKKLIILGLILILSFTSCTALPRKKTPEQIYQDADYVVKLVFKSPSSTSWEGRENWGSGFIIKLKKQGFYALTAGHNLAGLTAPFTISARFKDGTPPQKLEIAARSINYDAILLKFSDPKFKPKKIAKIGSSASLKPGSKTLAIGFSPIEDFCFSPNGFVYALAGPPSNVLKTWTKSRFGQEWNRYWPTVILTDNSVFTGYSGAPLLNKKGEVVGMVVGYVGISHQTVMVSLPIDDLKSLLNKALF